MREWFREMNLRKTVYVSGKDIPTKYEWNKHINNLVEQGKMDR